MYFLQLIIDFFFLGGNTGTVRNCLIRPLNALTELLR